MSRGRTVAVTIAVAMAMALAACTNDGTSSDTSTSSSVAPSSSTSTVADTAAATTTTTAVPATETPTTPAPTSPPDTTVSTAPASNACPDGTTIPSGATDLVAINGDIDGDTLNDVVTSYSLDGVPHVHATLATGGNSDTEVPIGNADTVSIQFMDFDHSLASASGTTTPPTTHCSRSGSPQSLSMRACSVTAQPAPSTTA
jgi:hypothetical protein